MADGDLHAFVHNLCRRLSAGSAVGPSDAELLGRWTAGRDEAAFELLLRRHAPLVLGVCRRLLRHPQDVEDAFQAAFLLLVRKGATIRCGASVAGWLYRVAYRVALRARSARPRLPCALPDDLAALPASADEELLWRDLRPVLDEEVNALPEKYRSAFVLCHLQGKTNQEAADVLGCPLGTVLSRLSWARQRLRSRLARRGLAVSTAVLGEVLARNAAAAPAALIQTALTTSVRPVAGVAAARPFLLAEGVSKVMLIAKVKLAAAAATAACLLALGTLAATHRREAAPGPGTSAHASGKQAATDPANRDADERSLQDVASLQQGQILVLGTEVDPKTLTPERKKELLAERKLITIKRAFLAIEDKEDPTGRVHTFKIKADSRTWRRCTEEDEPEPNRIRVVLEEKTFVRLQTGSRVHNGQLLGLIDPAVARQELRIKIAKLDASAAELRSSTKTREEAKLRYDDAVQRNARLPGTVAPGDLRGFKLTWERYAEEEKAKIQNVNVARQELLRALAILRLYEIRSALSGAVERIDKYRGEWVKEGETVCRIRGGTKRK